MKQFFTILLAAIVMSVAFFAVLWLGLQQDDKRQCMVWMDYRFQYGAFKPSKIMIDQCNSFDINLER